MAAPKVLAVGYLSIDALSGGFGACEDVPGGAALYAALGARHAGAAAALVACVGDDYPAAWLREIEALGIDARAVERRPGPTRRASLSHARTGERRSTHDGTWWARTFALAPPRPRDLPGVAAVAAGPMPAEELAAWAVAGRAADVPVVADASEAFAGGNPGAILDLLPALRAFAPSREETRLLCPGRGDDEAALALARLGPAILQKRGAEGAFAVAAGGGEAVPLPAPPARVIDPTGAGDAATGALAAALARGLPFFEAARSALVVGARAVAGVGPSAFGLDLLAPSEARRTA